MRIQIVTGINPQEKKNIYAKKPTQKNKSITYKEKTMAFSTFNSIQSFLNYVRARITSSTPSFTYNFPAIDPSLVLYYPMDTSANVGGGFKTPNYSSGLPVYDASMAGSSMITLVPGTYSRGIGDLSLNNTLGSTATNYVVANNTFAPNISGGFSIAVWFSCSGQLNKTGTLITLPSSLGGIGIRMDVSGTNMIYSGHTNPLLILNPIQAYSFDSASGTTLTELVTNTSTTDTSVSPHTVNKLFGTGTVINTTSTYIISGAGSLRVPSTYSANNNSAYNTTSYGAALRSFTTGANDMMTISFWYYLTDTPNSSIAAQMFQMAPSPGYSDNYNIKIQWIYQGTSATFQIYPNTTANNANVSVTLPAAMFVLNTWKFIAMSISTSGINIYSYDLATNTISQVATNVTLQSSTWANFQGKTILTNLGTGTYNQFPGYYDNYRVYNYALTSAQVQSIINLDSGKTLGGAIDLLSASAKTAMLYSGTTKSAGAYGTRLLNSAYTGAVMKIRKSTDASQTSLTDFYADINGNLGTGANGTGTSLSTWLGGAYAFVTIWYDQTGNGNNATQTTAGSQPVYNQTSKFVDFGTGTTGGQSNAYFNVPTGAYPYGNSAYTYVFKHGAVSTNTIATIYFGGTISADSQTNFFQFNTDKYADKWWNNDYLTPASSASANAVITSRYDGLSSGASSRKIYINGATSTLTAAGATGSNTRSQTSSPNYLGTIIGYPTAYLNTSLYYLYWAPTALSDADRNVLEGTAYL